MIILERDLKSLCATSICRLKIYALKFNGFTDCYFLSLICARSDMDRIMFLRINMQSPSLLELKQLFSTWICSRQNILSSLSFDYD
jgi:hypothetical protein